MRERFATLDAPAEGPPDMDARCLALTCLGDFRLQPRTWARLRSFLEPLCNFGSVYEPQSRHAVLHMTLQQCQRFGAEESAADQALAEDILRTAGPILGSAPRIVFRGLELTPAGLIMRGFVENDSLYHALRSLLPSIFERHGVVFDPPYDNAHMFHATVLRWTRAVPPEAWEHVRTFARFDEADFGELVPSHWIFGRLTRWVLPHKYLFDVCIPRVILHRGNLIGAAAENDINIIKPLVHCGASCEIDVWAANGKLFIGHDSPETEVDWSWVAANVDRLLLHAKDEATFAVLVRERFETGIDVDAFYHTNENVVLTTRGTCIPFPGRPVFRGWCWMLPEQAPEVDGTKCGAVCSDEGMALLVPGRDR